MWCRSVDVYLRDLDGLVTPCEGGVLEIQGEASKNTTEECGPPDHNRMWRMEGGLCESSPFKSMKTGYFVALSNIELGIGIE